MDRVYISTRTCLHRTAIDGFSGRTKVLQVASGIVNILCKRDITFICEYSNISLSLIFSAINSNSKHYRLA